MLFYGHFEHLAGAGTVNVATVFEYFSTPLLTGKVRVPEEAPEEKEKPPRPQYYVVGGDYFGQEDFERLEQEGFSVTTPVFGAQAGRVDYAPAVAEEVDRDRTMVSETLAQIYAQQELYQRSIEIYKKLILFYPEKIDTIQV